MPLRRHPLHSHRRSADHSRPPLHRLPTDDGLGLDNAPFSRKGRRTLAPRLPRCSLPTCRPPTAPAGAPNACAASPPTPRACSGELVQDRRLSGLKFRRQAPIDDTVVDFLCFEHRLVIEIDGGIHVLHQERDAARDAMLAAKKFRVLRFANADVLQEPAWVSDVIRRACGLAVLFPAGLEARPYR